MKYRLHEAFDPEQSKKEELQAEFPRTRRPHGCHDRMCGASDCPTCYPGSWWLEFQDEEPESEPEENDP